MINKYVSYLSTQSWQYHTQITKFMHSVEQGMSYPVLALLMTDTCTADTGYSHL